MPKTIGATLLSILQGDAVELFIAVQLEFDSGDLNIWSGIGDRVIGGVNCTGTGAMLSIGGMGESTDMTAHGASITLSGVSSAIISTALTEPYQGRPGAIYLGEMNTTEVVNLFYGPMDVMTISDTGETSTITLTLESYMVALDRPNGLRYTDESQRTISATDTFFSYVADLQDKDVLFGRTED